MVSGGQYLIVEILNDNLFHFEFSAAGEGPSADQAIYTSPMVAKKDYAGPSHYDINGFVIETPATKLSVNPDNLCFLLTDKIRQTELTALCPDKLNQPAKSLTIDPKFINHVYGLGQYFATAGSADGDWVGRVWEPGEFGNNLHAYSGGAPSYTQMPVMYALGKNNQNYALFLDHLYKQRWDFTGFWWRMDTFGDQIRGYLMTGPDLPSLRSAYMDLVGHPRLLPKKMLGLWVSQFGFTSWDEITGTDGVLTTLRANRFPIDGFAMDLEWYGGSFFDPNNPDARNRAANQSRMGSLQFDNQNFPNAPQKIASLKQDQGVDLMLIEQSYVAKNLDGRDGADNTYTKMQDGGFLVKDCENCGPTFLDKNPWWGFGGMIDWTNPASGDFWHDQKRQKLIDLGIHAHWTDLGEPEMFNSGAWYYGFPELNKHAHADIHNIYNFKWLESIARGYDRQGGKDRFYSMSRSGASGIQRFGAGMWSGDLGANLGALTAHLNSQMEMSFSGIDYYSSDIGGFHRWSLDGDENALYTQWFANGAMFDIPMRPHSWDINKDHPTAPDRVGDKFSNLDNIRQRYELAPYYYTLAYRAYLYGEPVIPPLVYYYQSDDNVRSMGNEKLIGRDLLAGVIARYGQLERDMYLPAGKWFDYYNNNAYQSAGERFPMFPAYRSGRFKLPLFARAGAIIPKAFVDDATLNILGKRSDGSRVDDLTLRVYADANSSHFTVYEDDGVSTGYSHGESRLTTVRQQLQGSFEIVNVDPSVGQYAGAPMQRNVLLELVSDTTQASSVTLNGRAMNICNSRQDVYRTDAPACYWNTGDNLTLVRTGSMDVGAPKKIAVALVPAKMTAAVYFICNNGSTNPGESVYVSGSIAELGSGDPAKALKLDPAPYPTWTGIVSGLPLNTKISWKCIKHLENDNGPLPGAGQLDHSITTQGNGTVVESQGEY